MNKLTGKSAKCKDCNGLGWIKTLTGYYTECIICNSSGWSVTRVGTGTKFGAKLNDVVNKIYNTDKNQIPTPTAHDSKNVTFPISQKGKSTVVGNMLKNEIPKPGGKLNPTFVEFLMGFPESWTKIDPTE